MARGSIRKRGPTWTVVVDVGRDPITNRRRQTSRGGFTTRREATRWLTDVQARLDQGSWVTPTKETTGAYLLGWLAAIRSSKKPSTYGSYERMVRGHLLPRLGHIYLHQLALGTCRPRSPTWNAPAAWTALGGCRRGWSTTPTPCSARPWPTRSRRAG